MGRIDVVSKVVELTLIGVLLRLRNLAQRKAQGGVGRTAPRAVREDNGVTRSG